MLIRCVVKPRSRADGVSLNADNSLKVKIKAVPANGGANEYLVKYLSTVFLVPQKNIEILSGFTGSHKRVNIVADEAYIQRILAGL